MKGIRRVLRFGGTERSVDEELRYHFDRTIDELVARGASREDAEAEARRRFGDVSRYRKQLEVIDKAVARRRRWAMRVDVLQQSVRYAVRSFGRSPGLAVGVILAFSLGIGVNLTMYSVVERLLLRPPQHIVDAGDVRRLYVSEYIPFMGDRLVSPTLSYPDYRALAAVDAFEAVAALAPREVMIGSGLAAESKAAVFVSGGFFDLLGVRPALGRFLTAAEDRVGGVPQVVLGHRAWQRDYGGSADVLGRTIDFGHGPYEVIGVAPAGFTGVDLAPVDLWLPFHVVGGHMRGTAWLEDHGEQFFTAVVRLRDEATEATVAQAATSAWIAGRAGTDFASDVSDPRILLTSVLNARGPEAPAESTVARLLLIVAVLVLLIASVNVANLLLARSLRQRREIAVRLALGVSRRRLIFQMMLEGVLLATVGGAAALLLAAWGGELMTRLMMPDVEWNGVLNERVIALAVVLAAVAGAAAALAPALQALRDSPGNALRQAGAGSIAPRTTRLRTVLALSQTALCVVLLVGAGLFIRSLDRVANIDYGFDPRNLIFVVPRPVAGGIPADEMREIMERSRASVERVPGVRSAGLTRSLPFYAYSTTVVRAEGVDSIPVPPTGGPFLNEISPGYLSAMDLEVVDGRDFDERDGLAAQPVALVNRSMADALWPGRSALGRCLYVGRTAEGQRQTRCSEIVGVIEDSRLRDVARVTTFQYYVPVTQQQTSGNARILVVRAADETAATLRSIQRAVLELDPRIRYVDADPLMSRIEPQTRSWRLGAVVFSLFGLLALVVASLGLYSLLAFDVAQRSREIGVRTALGASRGAVIRLVVRNALRTTGVGLGIGIAAALALAGRVEPLLFETPARDPATLAGVVLTLLVVAVLASSMPAWRAARVDPNIVLRAD